MNIFRVILSSHDMVFNQLNAIVALYRNQSIDLLFKSMDWFLYEGNTGI